ncbi:MAG: outer membrane beta-barrel protein [Paludibacter sp.]|nr:outer membrane beta-barrel protein [Paludibacter sp.]
MKEYFYRPISIFLFFLFNITGINAQSFIKGTVTDKRTGEALTGATILIEGSTAGTTADIDGNYEIKVSPGNYTLIVSYVSYATSKLTNIKIKSGETTTLLIQLEEASLELKGVQVVARTKTDTDLSLIRNIRTSLQVVSGISSQQIGKTLDKDASEVVKRVPGVTIQDNRFIVVRGLNQRYNNVWLNNASTPSSETDIKAFSFDAVPSNMIDNLLVYKTGSAENPAEATGGFIKISTKNIPDKDFSQFEYSISYNNETTFKEAFFHPIKALDLFAAGSISRNIPKDYPENLNKLSVTQRDLYALKLPANWTPQSAIAFPNQKISYTFGNKWNIHSAAIGTNTSVSYSNSYNTRNNMQNYMYERYDEQNKTPVYLYKYQTDIFAREFRIGIMHNWAYQDTTGNSIEFKHLFNQIGIESTANSQGWNNYRMSNFQYFSHQYSARTTYSGQLIGKHLLTNNEKNKIDWNIGFSYANRIEPDRQNRSNKETSPGIYQYVIPDIPSINELGRLYMKNHEFVYIAAVNWERKYFINGLTPSIKAGTYNEYKTRRFSERSITYRNAYGNMTAEEINSLTFEALFTSPYLGNGKVLSIDEQTNVANNYSAQNHLSSGYIALIVPIGKFNINTGLRTEFNRMMLQGYYNASSPVNVDNPKLRFFPSLNSSYNFDDKNLLRIAYSQSINRPEFREIAPLTYYDFAEKNSIVGNPNLLAATIQNVDLRFEHYPTPGETYTLAAFFKDFQNPIEMVSIGAGSLYSFDNAVSATNYGIELEIKKSLGFIGLNHLSVNVNASLIKSIVKFENQQAERNRALQGQSPYVVNAGIYYQNDDIGLSSTIMYNVMGKRIIVAAQLNQGVVEVPDIYEMPRQLIDFTLNKKLGKQFEVKFGIKDLLARDHITQQTFNYSEGGTSNTITLTNKRYNTGRTISIGINWTME